jgi:sialic acid synthase SpsE
MDKEEYVPEIRFDSGHVIGEGHPTFIIAEIGSNHDQDLKKAVRLIADAASCGADAVKFQSIDFNELQASDASEATRELYKKINLNPKWYPTLFDAARSHGLIPMSCPTYLLAVDQLMEQKISLFKIASSQALAFPQLLEKVAITKVPTIISTGYCDAEHVRRAVEIFSRHQSQIVLLHCNSQYPVPDKYVGLKEIIKLQQTYGVHVGFSDHSEGDHVPLGAVALGARVLERHITLDRHSAGPDHYFATEIPDFRRLISKIRSLEKALQPEKIISVAEKEAGLSMRMAVFANRNLKTGDTLTGDNIKFLRHGRGLSAEELFSGRDSLRLKKSVTAGTLIDHGMLNRSSI